MKDSPWLGDEATLQNRTVSSVPGDTWPVSSRLRAHVLFLQLLSCLFPARPRWFSETCIPLRKWHLFFFSCKAGIEIENLIYQEEYREEGKYHLSLGLSLLTFGRRPGCLVLTAVSPGPGAQQVLKKYL